jgi:hypothetical protein
MSLAFDFRDWKYLSQHIRKSVTIKDADIIVGNKEGEIEVDFSEATKSDKQKKTQYIVGGRLFWETHVFGNYFISYTTNGFFDQKDYQEPQIPKDELKKNLIWIIPTGIVVLLLMACFISGRCEAA